MSSRIATLILSALGFLAMAGCSGKEDSGKPAGTATQPEPKATAASSRLPSGPPHVTVPGNP